MVGRTTAAFRPMPAPVRAPARAPPMHFAPIPEHSNAAPRYLPIDDAAAPRLDRSFARYHDKMDTGLGGSHALYRPMAPPATPGPTPADPPAARPAGKHDDAKTVPDAKAKDKAESKDGKAKVGGKKDGGAAQLGGDMAAGGMHGPAAGGAAHVGGQSAEKSEQAPAALPPAQAPATGGHRLARPSFGVRLSPGSFGESRELGVRPATPKAGAGGSAPAKTEPVLDHRSLYAASVEESYSVYRRLNDEALRILADADRRDRELAAFHQSALDASLSALDGSLADSRTRLAGGSEQLRAELDTAARRLRRRITNAAGGALAALDARLKTFKGRLAPLEKRRDGITGSATTGTAEIVNAGTAAAKKLGEFAKSAEGGVPQKFGVMQSAIREAQVTYAPGYAELDQKAILATANDFKEYLDGSFKCLGCDFDRAFQSLKGQCETMQVAGPKAVYAAQDGALKAVDSTVESLRKAIAANEDATERGLVAQHQRSRESLIAAAEGNTAQEAEALSQTAERQGEGLVAMASGQPAAVRQVRDLLTAQAGLAPPQFGQAVQRATGRLRTNLAGIAAKQPRATVDNAARLASGQLARARQFEARQRGVVHGVDLGLDDVVEQALAQLDKQIADTFAGMDHVPIDVRASCNASLAPAGPALDKAVQDLTDAVGAVGARVYQILNGGDAMAKHDAAVKARKAKEPAPAKDPPGDKKTKDKAPPAAPAEPPTCGNCGDEGGKGEKTADKADTKVAPPDGGQAGNGAAKNEAKGPAEGDAATPNGFKAMCEKVTANPVTAPQVAAFMKRAEKDVPKALAERVTGITSALATTFAPDTGTLMANLRGLTAAQGQAVSYLYWKAHPSTTLHEKIRQKYFEDSKLSSGDTDKANYNGAINALAGRNSESAMSELVAAFNYSNENQRIRDVLLSLTPQQIDELKANHGDKLKELGEQLDGEDKRIFEALLAKNPAVAKANGLLEGIDKINEEQRGQKRGDAIAKKLTDAQNDFHDAIEGDPERKTADIFHFEAQTEAVTKRNKGHWDAVQAEFVKLEPVKAAVGAETDPKAAILDYATRKVRHDDEVGSGEYSTTITTYDTVNDYHKEWIGQILNKGPDSIEAKGARLLVEEQRDKADLTGLDAAIHSGAGDAREGGGYDEKARAKGKEEAEAERIKVLEASEAARAKIEKTPAGTATTAKERLQKSFAKKLSDDPEGQRVAAGMLKSDAGDPAAIMDYALKHEKSELALMQLKRMDRKEIRDFVRQYNKDNPDKPGLYQRMGVFQHHGKSGTVFDGDEANDLTIAFMGVPQNDKERGEVALKTMKLTIDQSGAMGRGLANEEYKALLENARRLKQEMGITDAQVDGQGFIKARDRDGNKITGNFDRTGNLVPRIGGDSSAFETAVAMAKVTSSSYTQATDRIANFITTALMVIAAVVTTVLTGGAAASIWIPVLVTAGAGLIGMALTASIKGDRYTRAEMLRDLVMTVVQAATAGIGAAVGAGLRGGAGAAKALASSMRMSEQALAEVAGKGAMLRGLTLAEEMAIGAGSSAISGGVGAAVDPAARRGDDYGMGIFHGMLRGAIGGAAGAGVTRGVSQGIGSLTKGVAARSGAAAVLARGGSLPAAARVAQMRAAALGTSALTEIGTRSLASGLSGAATRAVDLGYNATVLNQKVSAGQFFEDVGWAFVQNAAQGAAEGVADRGMRGLSKTRAEEHDFTTQGQNLEFQELGLKAMVKEGRRRGLIPPAPAPDPAGAPKAPAKSGTDTPPAQEEAKAATTKADKPVDELPAIVKLPKPHQSEEEALGGLGKLVDPEGAPEPPVSRPAMGESDPTSIRVGTMQKGDNDNAPPKRPIYQREDLSKVDMAALGKLPVASVIVHPDSKNIMAANDNFGRLILADPGREVAHFYNPETGESMVVQGNANSVARIMGNGAISDPGPGGIKWGWTKLMAEGPKGHWILRSHYHPDHEIPGSHPLLVKLPSGGAEDVGVLVLEAINHGLDARSSRIYYMSEGKLQYTDFGIEYDHASNTVKKVWIDLPGPDGVSRRPEPFNSVEAYHDFVKDKTGIRPRMPMGAYEADISMMTGKGQPRALEPGSVHQELSPKDFSDLLTLHQTVAAGDAQEAHATVKRMGLVGEPDSMARLNLALNDQWLPLHVRQSLADTVFSATREHMIASGQLAHGEELHMFFHGAPEKRSASLKEGGIDLGKVKGGSDDDFGQAFYLTSGTGGNGRYSGLENAELYAGRSIVKDGKVVTGRTQPDGEVFAFFARGRDLGTVVDVTKGGKHRAAWEAFLNKSPLSYPAFGGHVWSSTRDFLMRGGIQNRGDAFDAFLKSPGFVGEFGAAVARPDLVIGTLGESGLTNGIGRGDQAALRVGADRLAALMNEQIGFRTPTPVADNNSDIKPHSLVPPKAKPKRGDTPAPLEAEPPAPRPTRKRTRKAETESEPAADAAAPKPRRASRRKKLDPAAEEATDAAPKKQGQLELDPGKAKLAAFNLEKALEKARVARRDADEAEVLRERVGEIKAMLAAEKPDRPAGVNKMIDEIMREHPDWDDRAIALARQLEDPDLGPDARYYIEWLSRRWMFNHRFERAFELTDHKEPRFARDQEAREAEVIDVPEAQRKARDANMGLKQRMREKIGPNYRAMKKNAKYDRVMGKEAFEARQAAAQARETPQTLKLSPDHLISLSEISNMRELTPIFDLYAKAPAGMRDRIEKSIADLGDISGNLVPMWDAPNQWLKSNKSWHEISYEEAAAYGYTRANVDAIRIEEDKMRAAIKVEIKRIIDKYHAELVATGRIVDKSPTLELGDDDEEEKP